ncbi:MAG TPA: TetR family transcriptional regulator C-terminal domain-containing protein [Solirubrobacteraceae bacterium]|nr:TetR family transcriptional regulator C-terminal domain-containing protein [Solirubrobacteraceae bacterium]
MSADSRQNEVATAARRAMLRRGIGATLREIAREGGFTTGLVSHYFPDKRAVVVGAFAAASEDFIGMVRESLAAATDSNSLLSALIEAAVPSTAERQAEWRLWAEMWAYAGRDREFAAVIEPTDALWVREIEQVLFRLIDDGILRSDVDAASQAVILGRLVDGLGIRAWLSGDWDQARSVLLVHLRSLGLSARLASALEPKPKASALEPKPRAAHRSQTRAGKISS